MIGSYGFLGPKAGAETFAVSGPEADSTFGAVTVLTGVFGTLAGGLALDALGSGIATALQLSAVCSLVGWAPLLGSCVYLVMALGRSSGLCCCSCAAAGGGAAVWGSAWCCQLLEGKQVLLALCPAVMLSAVPTGKAPDSWREAVDQVEAHRTCMLCCRFGGVMSAFVLAKSLHAFVVPFAIGELALFALQVVPSLMCPLRHSIIAVPMQVAFAVCIHDGLYSRLPEK